MYNQKKVKIIVVFILILMVQNLFAQEKCKVLKVAGKVTADSVDKTVNDTMKKNSDWYILDFSKADCAEWNGEKGFQFINENERLVGIILPDSILSIDYLNCHDLKFVQFSKNVKEFSKYPFSSSSLRYIFITETDDSDLEKFKNSNIRNFNSAKIISKDCFEYAKENKISLFKLKPAKEEKDYNLYIPPEVLQISTEDSVDNKIYSIITTTEVSDYRDFSYPWIKLNETDSGCSKDQLKDFETVFNKMNEFISWNRNNFYHIAFPNWTPKITGKMEFYAFEPNITVFENYISISVFFTYYGTGWMHETHEYKSFCYDTKSKQFVNLSKASGWTNEELQKIIQNVERDDLINSDESLNLSLETIEDLQFEFQKNGKINILVSDYIINRYNHVFVIERKKR